MEELLFLIVFLGTFFVGMVFGASCSVESNVCETTEDKQHLEECFYKCTGSNCLINCKKIVCPLVEKE